MHNSHNATVKESVEETKETMRLIRFERYLAALLLTMVTLVGFIIVGRIVQVFPPVIGFDRALYAAIHHGPHHPILDAIVYPFNFNFLPWGGTLPSYFYFLIMGTLLYLSIKKRNAVPWAIITFILATLIAHEITSLHWDYVQRDRPFLSLPNNVLPEHQEIWRAWNSFPSGHSRETALYATIIAAFIPQLRIALLLFSIFIAWSRVYLGAHFPTDVISGLIVGYLVARITLILVGELQMIFKYLKGKRYDLNQQPQPGKIDTQNV